MRGKAVRFEVVRMPDRENAVRVRCDFLPDMYRVGLSVPARKRTGWAVTEKPAYAWRLFILKALNTV